MRQVVARCGQELVVDTLRAQGYTIYACNYRIRAGEIDIVACKDEVLAIVEVKTRSNNHFNLSQVIVPAKQRALIRTAKKYILEHQLSDVVIRFDVALVHYVLGKQPELTYITNAFTEP